MSPDSPDMGLIRYRPSTTWKLPNGYFPDALGMIRKQWFIAVGNSFEWYEFFVFGYLAAPINVNFFKGNSDLVWATFGIGMVMRTVGAIFFGWFGDNFGRRKSLLYSIAGMTIGTILPGCLPSYYSSGEKAGQFGVVMLVMLRALQGFCVGGQTASCSVHLAEMKHRHLLGAGSCIVMSGSAIGMILASGVAALLSAILSTHQLNLWGWRLPFLAGVFPGLVAFFGRNSLTESHMFEQNRLDAIALQAEENGDASTMPKLGGSDKQNEAESKNIESHVIGVNADAISTRELDRSPAPIKRQSAFALVSKLVRSLPFNCLLTFLGMFACASQVYVGAGSWQVSFIQVHGAATTNGALYASLVSNGLYLSIIVLLCVFIDAYGVGMVSMVATSIAAIATPFLWIAHINTLDSAGACYFFTIVFGAVRAFSGGATVMYWAAEMYPTNVRMTGFVFYNLPFSLIGGVGPVIANILADVTLWGPMGFMTVMMTIGAGACTAVYVVHCRGYLKVAHIRPDLY